MRRRCFLAGMGAAASFAPLSARTETSDEFVLADIIIPALAIGGYPADPYADAAHELRRRLSAGDWRHHEVRSADRWGRRVVHAFDKDGQTLQAALLKAGATRVAPESEDYPLIETLIAAESDARAAGRGLWARRVYRVRDTADPDDLNAGFFQIAEGVCQKVFDGKGRYYLNFGDDFRTDVTATIEKRAYRKWPEAFRRLDEIDKTRIRVRGYVAWINGPSIALQHPQALEILE